MGAIILLAVAVTAGVVLTRYSLRDVAAAAGKAPHPPAVSPDGKPVPVTRAGTGPHGGRSPDGAWTLAATRPGPDGIEARWVIAENNRPGTTAWKIRHPKGSIAGFASRTYARRGQRVTGPD